MAVQIDIPNIKAIKGRARDIVYVPRNQVLRIVYHNLKSLLEATKFGILKKEDVFLSQILTQLPDGKVVKIKEIIEEKYISIPESFD